MGDVKDVLKDSIIYEEESEEDKSYSHTDWQEQTTRTDDELSTFSQVYPYLLISICLYRSPESIHYWLRLR